MPASEQIGRKQILLVVEATAPLVRIVERQEDVVQSVDRPARQTGKNLGEEHRDVRVRKRTMAVVDEEHVFATDRIEELRIDLLARLSDDSIANLIDSSARKRVDGDDRRPQAMILDGLSREHRRVTGSDFD